MVLSKELATECRLSINSIFTTIYYHHSLLVARMVSINRGIRVVYGLTYVYNQLLIYLFYFI